MIKIYKKKIFYKIIFAFFLFNIFFIFIAEAKNNEKLLNIGLNYPETGPYSEQGLDQYRALQLAAEEINNSGGILGKKINIIKRDSKSNPEVAVSNTLELIEKFKVKMILGGVSSAVALAVSEIAQKKQTLFMATITASNTTTGENAHRHTFRACFNA